MVWEHPWIHAELMILVHRQDTEMTEREGPWIVAGMHRSGTSLIASAVVSAGVDVGTRLLPGDVRNPPGYFEDLDFLDLDRRILAAACPSDDGGHPDWGWTESERLDIGSFEDYRDEARSLVEARAARGIPWGFKDPRATLLLDFWLSLAPDARFILPYRLPWQVADSLQRLGAEVFLMRPDYGYRIWAYYNRHLLDFHRRHPERTVLLSVDATVNAVPRLADLLRERIGLQPPLEALEAQFKPVLLSRFPPDDPLVALAGATHPECVEILAALDAEADLPATGLWHRDSPRPRRLAGEPQVAVVIPCFDDGEFVVEAVASVERSVPVPYELIVVDDGSRDRRTRDILGLLHGAGYDIHFRPHAGLAAARNHGFASTRAPFVIPLDADNRLVPGFVGRAIETLNEGTELAAVYGDRIEFGLRSRRVEVGEFDPDLLVANNYVDACAVIRRQAWQDCGGYDEAMPAPGIEDWELWLRAIDRGWALRWLPLPAFAYRVRPSSMLSRLKSSPEYATVHGYLVAKHHALFLAALRQKVLELRDTRQELDRNRASLDETRRALEEAERRYKEAAGEVHQIGAERDALERQRRFLHRLLQTWREGLSALESTRMARLRSHVVRIRSRIGGRARTGPGGPCVIGASAGSDSGVFARLAERGGLYIGSDRDQFEDALPIERCFDGWLVPFWKGGGNEPPHLSPPGMDDEFFAALQEHLVAYDARAGGPSGWKSPRSLYLLPFLLQRFPDLRFLHVVRDGRDIALSCNDREIAPYETMLLPPSEDWLEAEHSIALWSRVNTLAADLGERLSGVYLRVRLEDLCEKPVKVTRRVFRFFGLPGDPRAAAPLIEAPASLGRWQRADPAVVARLERIGGTALRRFGYAAADRQAVLDAG